MAHIHEKIDFTAEAFIVFNNKVLLRIHDKYNMWLGVGGHIELDEDPNQAVIREIKEEVGLDVCLYHRPNFPALKTDTYEELIPPMFLNRHRINDVHEHVSSIYFARATTDKLVLSKTEVSAACKWFSKEDLDNPEYSFNDNLKFCALAALDALRED